MRPVYHVVISGGVSAAFSLWAKSWSAVLACFLSGIFIDLDHYVDYYIMNREIPLSYKKFASFFSERQPLSIYVFLHSYEFLLLFWLIILVFDLGMIWVGIAIGFTTHVLCDEIFNPMKPKAYFYLYRKANRFERKRLCKSKNHEPRENG